MTTSWEQPVPSQSRVNHRLRAMREFVMALIQKISQDDCAGLAAEMAYHLILSLTPFIFFMTALSGLFGGRHDVYEVARDFIARFAPVPAIDLLNGAMNAIIHGSSTGLTTVGLLGTLWSASGAAAIVVKGLHRSYQLSERTFPFWYGPVLSICVVLSLGLVTVLATYLLMFGDFLSQLLSASLQMPTHWDAWLNALRWGIILVGIRWGTVFAYTLTLRPRIGKLDWHKAASGSWFFVFSWLGGSWLFSLYINHLHQLNPVYGSLGVLIILVTWFYYSAFMFFIGGEITALSAGCNTAESSLAINKEVSCPTHA
jgi:membrane protein